MKGSTAVSFNLSIPRGNGTTLDLAVGASEVLFLLGANGTGKSSLMHRFYSLHHSNARRIAAHRQTWFSSNAVTLSPEQKRQTENQIQHRDSTPEARWKDDFGAQRASIAISDLIDAENVRARSIADAVDNGRMDFAKELSTKAAPIKIINEILRLSNIPIEIAVMENDRVIARKNGGTAYSIAELSDGERNALLIASSVLTASTGTLLLIDEPERHLHRSIISPLLTLLFAKRPDCAFVVSTHEVMLPLDNPGSRTLLIRDCAFSGTSVTGWDADVISSESEIDDDLKRDILGARRKILFVEGTGNSLDKPLYTLVFPDVSVIAKRTCREIEQAVTSIRDSGDLHWLDAFGLVDNDCRPQADIGRLKARGIYATTVFSVEAIYYHPEIQRHVTERLANATGGEKAETRLNNAKTAAIEAVKTHAQRLSQRTAEKSIREEFFRYLPKKEHVEAGNPIKVEIDVPAVIAREKNRIDAALSSGDLIMIISRYPVRETPALDEIASRLGFRDRGQYEEAVRKLLMDDAAVLAFVRPLFGTLADDIARGRTTNEANSGDAASSASAELGVVA